MLDRTLMCMCERDNNYACVLVCICVHYYYSYMLLLSIENLCSILEEQRTGTVPNGLDVSDITSKLMRN